MTKEEKTKEPPADPVFECDHLALCVVEALVRDNLLTTSITIPELEPPDDYDPEDESESWRDAVEDNQTEAIDKLVALVDEHRDLLPRVTTLDVILVEIASCEYELDLWSLAGIEACTNLESIQVWSRDPSLDLSPLAALEKLHTVDVKLAKPKSYAPLTQIPSLRVVIGAPDAKTATALRARGVTIQAKSSEE
jgi:hypothetical protein